MNKLKKTLALLLSLVMILSIVPAVAFAEGEEPVALEEETQQAAIAETDVAKIGDVGYATLEAALKAAGAGDTITLLKDVNEYGLGGGNVTIDLNGHSIDGGNNWVLFLTGNAVITGNGYITSNYPEPGMFDDTEYEATIGIASGTLTISGGAEIRNTHEAGKAIDGFGSSVIVNGGSISANKAITGFSGDSISINGNVTCSTFVAASGLWGSGTGYNSITITGGTFNFDPTSYVDTAAYAVTESNGTYTVSPVVAASPVAQIGSETYTTLAAAIAAANVTGNCTIKLLSNYDMEANEPGYGYTTSYVAEGEATPRNNMIVISGDGITFDLGGYTISNLFNNTFNVTGDNVTIENGGMTLGQLYYGSYSSKNGVSLYATPTYGSYIMYVNGAQDLTVDGLTTFGGINVAGGSTAEINDLSFSGLSFYAVCSQENSIVTLNGGSYNKGISGAANYLFWVQSGSTMNITGGTYTKGSAKFINGINPVITGGTFDFDPTNNGVAEGYDVVEGTDADENITYTVQAHTHNYVYDTVVWRNIRGTYSAIFVYKCSCGEEEMHIVTPTYVDSYGERTYNATYENHIAQETKSISYTVYFEDEYYGVYSWGDACTLNASGTKAWYKGTDRTYDENDKVADGTETYVFPVVADTYIYTGNTESYEQQAVVGAWLTSDMAATAVFNAKWSIPTGATVTSVKIYRGYTSSASNISAATLKSRGTAYEANLKVLNGDYTLKLTGLTSEKYQHAVIEITYVLNDDTVMLISAVQRVQVQ